MQTDESDKTALVIGPGGLRGAYNAGAAVRLGHKINTDDIDSVYASSVGVYMGAFFAAGQFHPIEHVWRHLVHGDQLVDIKKIFQGRSWLDLEYLVDVLKRDDPNTWLDIDGATSSDTVLTLTLTSKQTGEPVYVTPSKQNIFPAMTASCAVPFMHSPVLIDDGLYLDGSIADPLRIKKAVDDGHDKVIAIDSDPAGAELSSYSMRALSWLFQDPVANKLRSYTQRKEAKRKRAKTMIA